MLVGASAANHKHGYETAAAAMMLNVILGNIGKTVVSTGEFPFPQLLPIRGNSRDLLAFSEGAGSGAFDVAFIYGTNPVYTAPKFLNLEAKLEKVPFKVVLSQFHDETTKLADVVLPLASALEDWGTHVPPYQPAKATIAIQQPLMDKLYPETKGFGDSVLTLLKMRNADEYNQFDDYYAYLRSAFKAMPSEHKGGLDDDDFWMLILQKGVLAVNTGSKALTSNPLDITSPTDEKDVNYPLHLVPSGRLGMWDGRHANIPWLQEAPDQISKVVWGSWAELHPKTAARIGVKTGDLISVSSVAGDIEVPVYLYRGVHPDVVAVPMGQGHTEYGRYAKDRGVNPLKIVSSTADEKTGELALYGTRVKITKVDRKPTFDEKMIRFGGSESQVGRKLVASVSADQFNRTEGA